MPPCAAISALFLAIAAPAVEGDASITGARAMALLRPAIDDDRGASPHAASRRVQVLQRGGRTTLEVVWELDADRAGWFTGALVTGEVRVRSVTIGGKPAATITGGATTYIAAWIDGPAAVELRADLRGDPSRGPVAISLMAASRGTAVVTGEPAWRFEAAVGHTAIDVGGVTHGGTSELQLVAAPAQSTEAARVAHGRVGIGVFVGDAEIRGHARLQWVLRRGEFERVTFVATGVGDDFTVVGPDVRTVTREGHLVQVELRGPVRDLVDLEATWSKRTPTGDAEITPPAFVLQDTRHTDASFELGRDGDVDVVPELPGWRQVAPQQLPSWGRDLLGGASAAAWTRHGAGDTAAGRLQLLRFVPVEAPDVVIATASFELASAAHGVTLIKARYAATNERASHLRITPPPASRILAIEVAGSDARVARDGDTYLVPIPRSLETMQGLLTIPVVISLTVTQPQWRPRGRREIPLPTVDAPIRSISARWLLPREHHATTDVGQDGVRHIESARTSRRRASRSGKAAEGVTLYDFEPDPTDAPEMRQAESDRLLREAQALYNSNEFDDAQLRIDELRNRGLANEDAARLQSNLDIVNLPVADGDAPSSVTAGESASAAAPKAGLLRRIKDQARARGQKQRIANDDRKRKAKELRAKGDYDAAEAEYRQVIEESRKLDQLEPAESASYDFETEVLEQELKSVESEKAARHSLDDPGQAELAQPSAGEESGMGAPWLGIAAALDVPDARASAPTEATPPNFGPRVLMPTRGGDVVEYAFDLWAPASAHSLIVAARRHRPHR